MDSTATKELKICRLCTYSLEESNENDLFSKLNKPLLLQIKELTGLTIKNMPQQKLPRYFCDKCKNELSSSYEFRRKVIKSQSYFKSKDFPFAENLNEENKAHIFDTVFIPSFDDNSNKELNINSLSDEDLSQNDENEITTECIEALMDIKMECPENSNVAIELRLKREQCDEADANCSPLKENITTNTKLETENINEDSSEDINAIESDSTYHGDSLSNDSDSEIFDLKLKPVKRMRKSPTKIKKEENLENSTENKFFCDICKGSYKNLKSLKSHERKVHKGQKKVKCDQCDEMFFTVKSLMRHTNFHKGEKPNKCHYCEMTFTYSSHRTRHERRNHARDCAFLCSLCGKTFTTHDMGKNHMLVHTKERAFHCTYCNASFLRKTHLTTHYRSETHKNNEQKFIEQSQALSNIIPVLNLHIQNEQAFSEVPLRTTVGNDLAIQQSPEG